ncbi:MAG: DUF1015 domain-containing protein, partial [Deltaproteobacteria bacterium]|nr:DUF1015 domain-containing protein [Deltaproteobacteria bacterium]
MANVRPFKALYYDPKKVLHLEKVFVPPYDVISEREQKAFFKKNPYNFARIILGKTTHDGYETARKRFQNWQAKKLLIEDSMEHFYFWEQKFFDHGQWVSRKGIVAAVALNDFYRGKIRPHEKTLDAPKADRLKILEACQANLSPVFMMYEDPNQTLEKEIIKYCQKPFLKMRDSNGIWNKIWKIEKEGVSRRIQKVFVSKNLYIIDGHHRFATALNYQKERRKVIPGLSSPRKREPSEGSSKKKPWNFILSVITNMSDPALVIYPIYRALPKRAHLNKEHYLKSLEKLFTIHKKKRFVRLHKNHWGIFFHKDPYFYELVCKNKGSLAACLKGVKGAKVVKELDVAILQNVIIPQVVIPQLEYIKGEEKAFKAALHDLHEGKIQALWLTTAPTVQQVKSVADHKATL